MNSSSWTRALDHHETYALDVTKHHKTTSDKIRKNLPALQLIRFVTDLSRSVRSLPRKTNRIKPCQMLLEVKTIAFAFHMLKSCAKFHQIRLGWTKPETPQLRLDECCHSRAFASSQRCLRPHHRLLRISWHRS